MKRFLIVDDDVDDREMFCEALQIVAPEAICDNAANGRKALMALESVESGLPDLIFLDINMPVMDGWQLISKLKSNHAYKDIPVIMFSTSSHEEDVEKSRELGALCFFTKPSNFKNLKETLSVVVNHVERNELSMLVEHCPVFLS